MFKDLYKNLTNEDKLLFSLLVDMQQLSYLMTLRNSSVIKAVNAFYDEQARQANASDPNAASAAQQEKDHQAAVTESLAPSTRVPVEGCPESENALPKLNCKK